MEFNDLTYVNGEGAFYTYFVFEEMTKAKQAAQLRHGKTTKDQILKDGLLKFPGGKRMLEISDEILKEQDMTGLQLVESYGDPFGRGYPTWKSVIVRGRMVF